MKKKHKILLAAVGLTAVVTAAAAAGTAGSSGDPLVTLSYLTGVFQPQVMEEVDQAVADNETQLKSDLDAAIEQWEDQLGQGSASSSTYQVVTLTNGQTLTGEVGCEVMLRVGSAKCVSSSSPGLIDTTAGTTLNNGGALVTNHLYMVTIDTRSVTATAATTKLLVRGSYTIS